jgi:hypothetical protein
MFHLLSKTKKKKKTFLKPPKLSGNSIGCNVFDGATTLNQTAFSTTTLRIAINHATLVIAALDSHAVYS